MAKSSAELQSKFERAFKSKDQIAFLSLFNWMGVDPETERRLKSDLADMLSKEFILSEVRDADLAIKDAKSMEGRGMYLNVTPVNTLYFARSVGPKVIDPREKTSGQFAVGRHSNCFVLGLYSRVKKQ